MRARIKLLSAACTVQQRAPCMFGSSSYQLHAPFNRGFHACSCSSSYQLHVPFNRALDEGCNEAPISYCAGQQRAQLMYRSCYYQLPWPFNSGLHACSVQPSVRHSCRSTVGSCCHPSNERGMRESRSDSNQCRRRCV